MQRRLAAIVHADIAGFTRMMEGSETRTFRHLKTAQIEVWRPASEGVCRGPSVKFQTWPSSRPSRWQLAQAMPVVWLLMRLSEAEKNSLRPATTSAGSTSFVNCVT